ncbi:OLC1v1000143C1 [Oldenlandia corymbosa var. corymbosa]|uniref:OLC1v1000143C1 n=1 Tax=Oldenlandia corymbosa var. corymbosa TaxID=529605 RepID=A0AAV1D228_OLDCO|nr:OLC1v1000143C1 [Oldenlandia corymbosa var. corymbosa]
MGSACCVAARDGTVTNGSASDVIHRNVRHSPSWSFRWDNRVRVVGDEGSVNWISDGSTHNSRFGIKPGPTTETAYASEEGSPLDSFRSLVWQKSPVSESNNGIPGLHSSDPLTSRNSADVSLVKESSGSPAVSCPSPAKMSPSAPSVSSFSASPLSSQSHQLPASSTPSRWPRRSPGHQLLRQVSDSLIKSPTLSVSEETSSFVLPGWSHDSTRGSHGGSSDSWSTPTFPDLVTTSRRERWSFDSETLGFCRDKLTRSSGRNSYQFDLQTCGICAKLLTEKSLWGSQKIIPTNELAVVAVLICGHVYHAECLENMTPEVNKYDPGCPVCTFGEKQAHKMSEKALRAELESKTRKRSRNRIADGDLSSDSVFSEHQKSSGHDRRGPKMSSSSSMKGLPGVPFLRRHFSLGSKGSRSLSENHSSRKRGFFWAKSRKN